MRAEGIPLAVVKFPAATSDGPAGPAPSKSNVVRASTSFCRLPVLKAGDHAGEHWAQQGETGAARHIPKEAARAAVGFTRVSGVRRRLGAAARERVQEAGEVVHVYRRRLGAAIAGGVRIA